MTTTYSDPRHATNATGAKDNATDSNSAQDSAQALGIDELDNFSLDIATAPKQNSKRWAQGTITWGEILGWMDAPANHKHAGNYVLGRLKGTARNKESILSRDALTLDADAPQPGFLTRLKAELDGHAAVVHTTHSSTSQAPRYRVIVPLARPLSPQDYRAAVAELMERIDQGREFDPGSVQPERYMFMPAVQDGQDFQYDVLNGALLDASALVEATREADLTEDAAPVPDTLAGPEDAEAYFRRALTNEADLLALQEEGGRNNALNRAAFKLGQIAHLWTSDDEDAEDVARQELRDACDENGLPGDEFDGSFDSGWRAGLSNPRDVQPAPVTVTGAWGPEDQNTRGQLRLAHRLAHAYRGQLMYVHGLGWHHWTGTHWSEDRNGAAMRAVDDLLRRSWADSFGDQDLTRDVRACQSGSAMKGILSIAQTLEGITATVDEVDADPWLLNVANGALDLHTLELRPHNPADRCTKVTRGAYNPATAGPDWARFLGSSLPDAQVRGFLQRYVGQALIGRFIEKKMVLLQGAGDNGKSVWAEAIANALGDYAMSAQPDMLLVKKNQSTFDGSVELRGRRWVVMSEVEKGRELAPATVKRLTGGDRIRARNLYEKNIEFDPSHTLVMLVNDLPNVGDKTEAMWERLRVVRWEVVIPREQRDVLLAEKLQAEADAVLSWVVDGLRCYQARNGLDEPQQVRLATEAYRNDNDDVRRFLDECVEASPGEFIKPSDLYETYMEWSGRNFIRHPLGSKTFSQEVEALPDMVRGGRNKYWKDVRLSLPEFEEEFSDDLL